MRKYIVIAVILMNILTIDANSSTPRYIIIASSNNEKDIEEAYEIKNELLKDYSIWSKGVEDSYQVCADHTSKYQATFYNGEYIITLGKGQGKTIEGTLQANYCSSSKDIQKKSWLLSLFS